MTMKASEILGCMAVSKATLGIDAFGSYPPDIRFSGRFVSKIGRRFDAPSNWVQVGLIESQIEQASAQIAELEALGFTKPGELTKYIQTIRERLERAQREASKCRS